MTVEKVLFAIETSCDETAISIIKARLNENLNITHFNILSHCVQTQIEIHQPFGGVVPEVAARDHLSKIPALAQQAVMEAKLSWSNIDFFAVTMGPGLIGSLMVGILFARGLALSHGKPLIGVNHIHAHLAPCLYLPSFNPCSDIGIWHQVPLHEYPALSLTVSGGHCHLSLHLSPNHREILGKSLDDACGEAFDKVGKLLGLGYPGGPHIERLAREAKPNAQSSFSFPSKVMRPKNKFDFSYSGLKTAVLHEVRKLTGQTQGKISGESLPIELKVQLAYEFQEAALGQLYHVVSQALESYPEVKTLFVAGGVAQNKRFRDIFSQLPLKNQVFAPPSLCGDNATMIALQAFYETKIDGLVSHPFSRYHMGEK